MITMLTTVRFALLAFAAFSVVPRPAHAQEKQIELRLDALSYAQTTDKSEAQLQIPGTAAVALYLNNVIALEARLLSVRRSSYGPEGYPKTTVANLGAAVFVPLHLGSARGRRGLFIAPGLLVNRASRSSSSPSGAQDVYTTVNYGVDLGFKHTLKGRVSWRHALTYRTGDDLADTYGATSGISIFFR